MDETTFLLNASRKASTISRKISSIIGFWEDKSSGFRDPNNEQISPLQTIVNIVILFGFGGTVFLLPYFIGPFQQGFFCDDETIRYPYKGNTVSTVALFGLGIGCIIVSIVIGEGIVLNRIETNIPRRKYLLGCTSVPGLIAHSIIHFGYSQVGLVAVLALMNITKFTVGRLRPHFMAVCKIENLDKLCAPAMESYIPASAYKCTGNPVEVREARLSFFSGHSAISMFCAVYAVLYLQSRIGRWPPAKVLLSIVQTMLVAGGLVVCYTRVSDNWHHWSDVLVGIIVGVTVAIWTAVFWSRLFAKENQPRFQKTIIPTYNTRDDASERANDNPPTVRVSPSENI